jgi:hypothetical protein
MLDYLISLPVLNNGWLLYGQHCHGMMHMLLDFGQISFHSISLATSFPLFTTRWNPEPDYIFQQPSANCKLLKGGHGLHCYWWTATLAVYLI